MGTRSLLGPASGRARTPGGDHGQEVIASVDRRGARPSAVGRIASVSSRPLGSCSALTAGRAGSRPARCFTRIRPGNCMLLAAQCHARGILSDPRRGVPDLAEAGAGRSQGEARCGSSLRSRSRSRDKLDRRADRRAARVLQDRVRVRRLTDRRSSGRGARGVGAAARAVDRRLARASAGPVVAVRRVAWILGVVRGDRGVDGRLVRSEGQADRRRRRRAGQRSAAHADPRVRARVGDRLSAVFPGAGRGDGRHRDSGRRLRGWLGRRWRDGSRMCRVGASGERWRRSPSSRRRSTRSPGGSRTCCSPRTKRPSRR